MTQTMNTQQSQEDLYEEREKLANKLTKFYFEPVANPGNAYAIDWDKVSDDDNFDCIPRNSKGIVQISLGDLKTMMIDVADFIIQDRQQSINQTGAKARIDELKRFQPLESLTYTGSELKLAFNDRIAELEAQLQREQQKPKASLLVYSEKGVIDPAVAEEITELPIPSSIQVQTTPKQHSHKREERRPSD